MGEKSAAKPPPEKEGGGQIILILILAVALLYIFSGKFKQGDAKSRGSDVEVITVGEKGPKIIKQKNVKTHDKLSGSDRAQLDNLIEKVGR